MSPNMSNFFHEFAAAAQAMEQLPKIEAERDDLRRELSSTLDRVQRLEQKLMDRSAEIDALHAKVREAEKARDDAETMFLECDDKLSAFRRLAQGIVGDIESLRKAQEPPAPVAPEPPMQSVQPEQASSDPQADAPVMVDPFANEPPTGQSATGEQSASAMAFQSAPTAVPSMEASAMESKPWTPTATDAEGSGGSHSPAAPTAEPSAGQSGAGSPAAPSTGATSTGPEGVGASPEPGPAIGPVSDPEPKKYMNYPDDRIVSGAWWEWYDRQTPEFRSAYRW